MKFLRKTTQYTQHDHKRNQHILKEVKTEPIRDKINNYKNKWIQHVRRMDGSQLLHAIMKYQPAGRRNPG
jgi:hypothetical protein